MQENTPFNFPKPTPGKQTLKILAIGPAAAVNNYIRTQYRLGYAEVGEWSPLLPTPNPGEVMSILTRTVT